jgi:hypothetical protein
MKTPHIIGIAALAIIALVLITGTQNSGPVTQDSGSPSGAAIGGDIYEYFFEQDSGQETQDPSEQDPEPKTQDNETEYSEDEVFQTLGGAVTIQGTVNYLDDNITLHVTTYTTGAYTIDATAERPDNLTYASDSNPDITDPVISWTWAANTSSSDSSINVTISADENLSACELDINGSNVSMSENSSTTFYYEWSMTDGNYTLRAYCNDTANNSAQTSLAWYNLDTSVNFTIEKSANISLAVPGDAINWTITINNTCISALEVNISDNSQSFSNSSVPAGSIWTVNYTSIAGCSNILNTADANASNGHATATESDSASVSITHCGDSVCNCGEDCSSCASDCGSCPDPCSGVDCDPYCSSGVYYYNGECDGGDCEYDSEDCDDGVACTDDSCDAGSGCIYTTNDANCPSDAWVDNGSTRWVETGDCTEKEQKAQEYRDYSCTASGCEYTITDSRWVDTGTTGNLPDGTTCTPDELECSDDYCLSGNCYHNTSECSCTQDSDCNDGIDCTIDSCIDNVCNYDYGSCDCIGSGDCPTLPCQSVSCDLYQCNYTPLADGTDCNDSLWCTVNDTCTGGSCSGEPRNCSDGNLCTDDSCSESLDSCVHTANTAPCDDGDNCTQGDTCSNKVCISGEYICDCTEDSDCVNNNPCKTVSCIGNECVYNNTEGECDDNDPCTSGDYCEDGICVGGEYVCSSKEECEEEWDCGEWGECINGTQTRICECSCDEPLCSGDNTTVRECSVNLTITPKLNLSVEDNLTVGDVLNFTVTDSEGNIVSTTITLIRPDGTIITANGSYIVDQSGAWRIIASKEGYEDAESETNVKGKKEAPKDLGSQVSKAVSDFGEFLVEEPIRLTLLLVTVIGIVAAFVFVKLRGKKSNIEGL